MEANITKWLEEQTGATRRQMALRLGQPISTFNRNIGSAEVIVAVCRAYDLNPIDGLVAGGIVTATEVRSAAGESSLAEVEEEQLLEEVLRRAVKRRGSVLNQPVILGSDGLPDYKGMSAADVKKLELAAQGEDKNIGHDDVPETT